jgi:hypothetical protein
VVQPVKVRALHTISSTPCQPDPRG